MNWNEHEHEMEITFVNNNKKLKFGMYLFYIVQKKFVNTWQTSPLKQNEKKRQKKR